MEQSIKLFVALGTQKFPFDRLINNLEKLVESGFIDASEVLVQLNDNSYKSSIIPIVNMLPYSEFNKCIHNATYVIVHGGVNSIISCMKMGRSFIIWPRRLQFNEHVDDHQIEIAMLMKNKFNVLVYDEDKNLSELLKESLIHNYDSWKSSNHELLIDIENFLLQ